MTEWVDDPTDDVLFFEFGGFIIVFLLPNLGAAFPDAPLASFNDVDLEDLRLLIAKWYSFIWRGPHPTHTLIPQKSIEQSIGSKLHTFNSLSLRLHTQQCGPALLPGAGVTGGGGNGVCSWSSGRPFLPDGLLAFPFSCVN